MKTMFLFEIDIVDEIGPELARKAIESVLKTFPRMGPLKPVDVDKFRSLFNDVVWPTSCACDTGVDTETGMTPAEHPLPNRQTSFWGEPVWCQTCTTCQLRRLLVGLGLHDPYQPPTTVSEATVTGVEKLSGMTSPHPTTPDVLHLDQPIDPQAQPFLIVPDSAGEEP